MESSAESLDLFLAEIGRYPLLTAAQEAELAKRIEQGDLDAKWLMVVSNLRLVVSIAVKYRRSDSHLTILGLVQDGTIGLIRAVEKFEWQHGFKFSTYAVWWIKQAVARGVADRGATIRVPVHIHERRGKLERAPAARRRTRAGADAARAR